MTSSIKSLIYQICLLARRPNGAGTLQRYGDGKWADLGELEYIKIEGFNNLYRIADERGGDITSFRLGELHGCCGVCVSYHANVTEEFRRAGINKVANRLRQEMARQAGFTVLLCTDVESNEPQRKTLEREGWQKIFQFTNRRTDNKVNISVKHL